MGNKHSRFHTNKMFDELHERIMQLENASSDEFRDGLQKIAMEISFEQFLPNP